MDLVQVIILAIVEGITEFIPVSSTGHMILVSSLMGSHGEVEKLFEVFIQLGAIFSLIHLYWDRMKELVSIENIAGGERKDFNYNALDIVLATLAPLVMGFLFYKKIKAFLFSPISVGIALIIGGILLLIVERRGDEQLRKKKIDSYKQSFLIGCFQCLSLWPGFSRSGSCIIGGRLLGLTRSLAAEFSFIVSLPLMSVAVLYDIYKNMGENIPIDYLAFGLGFFLAYVSAFFAVKGFISYISRNSLVPFGIYRIILGILVLVYFSL